MSIIVSSPADFHRPKASSVNWLEIGLFGVFIVLFMVMATIFALLPKDANCEGL